MGTWVSRRLDQFFDDVGRGPRIRVAHAEVDDVFPCGPSRRLQLVDFAENIGRKLPDAMKIHG